MRSCRRARLVSGNSRACTTQVERAADAPVVLRRLGKIERGEADRLGGHCAHAFELLLGAVLGRCRVGAVDEAGEGVVASLRGGTGSAPLGLGRPLGPATGASWRGRRLTHRELLDLVGGVVLVAARDRFVEVRLLAVVQDELRHDDAAAAALARDRDVLRVAAERLRVQESKRASGRCREGRRRRRELRDARRCSRAPSPRRSARRAGRGCPARPRSASSCCSSYRACGSRSVSVRRSSTPRERAREDAQAETVVCVDGDETFVLADPVGEVVVGRLRVLHACREGSG